MPVDPPAPPVELDLFGIKAAIYWDGYRKGESLEHGPWRDILYLVKWSESDDFIDRLMGLVRSTGGAISRTPPHRYPNNEVIYCLEAEGNPLGVPQPDARLYGSDYCVVRAHYEVPRFDMAAIDNQVTPQSAVPWAEWEVSGEPNDYPLPTASLKYEGSGQEPTKEFPLQVIDERMTLTVHHAPEMYTNLLRAYKGKLNSSAFEGLDIGQVLFNRYRLTQTIASDGTRTVKHELNFESRAVDWNMMPKDVDAGPIGAGAWDFVKGKTSSARPYGYAELNDLLTFFGVS